MGVPIMRLCESCRRKLSEKYIVNDLPGETLDACFTCVEKTWKPVRVCEVTPRAQRFVRRAGGGERARAGRR